MEEVFIDADMFKITKVFEIDIANRNDNNINNFWSLNILLLINKVVKNYKKKVNSRNSSIIMELLFVI